MVRGEPDRQSVMFVAVSAESLIPAGHPIRRVRQVVEAVLAELDGELSVTYSSIGRAECVARAAGEGHGADGAVFDPVGAGVL